MSGYVYGRSRKPVQDDLDLDLTDVDFAIDHSDEARKVWATYRRDNQRANGAYGDKMIDEARSDKWYAARGIDPANI